MEDNSDKITPIHIGQQNRRNLFQQDQQQIKNAEQESDVILDPDNFFINNLNTTNNEQNLNLEKSHYEINDINQQRKKSVRIMDNEDSIISSSSKIGILYTSEINIQKSNTSKPDQQKALQLSKFQTSQQFTKRTKKTKQDNSQYNKSVYQPSFQNTSYIELNNKQKSTWSNYGYNILRLMMMFVTNSKVTSQLYRFRHLSIFQFKLIGDQSSDYQYYRRNIQNHHCKFTKKEERMHYISAQINRNFILKLIKKNCWKPLLQLSRNQKTIIYPDSLFNTLWETIILFLLTINIFYIPIKMTYEPYANLELPSLLKFLLDDLPAYSFLLDILFNFNTASYIKGQLVDKRNEIVKLYIKGNFVYDVLIVGPYFLSKTMNLPYVDIILLLRTNKIKQISNGLFERTNPNESQQAIYDLCKLIFIILFVGHFCGCAFNLLSYLEKQLYNVKYTWLDRMYETESHEDSDWMYDYTCALYYSVITMITVGYGDIYPVNSQERLFIILITLLSCGIFAYALNSIGTIVANITQVHREFNLKMSLLSHHMNKRKISKELQMKIKKYFEYIHYDQSEIEEQGSNLIEELTGELKNEVKLEINGKLLQNRKLFNLNFSNEFINEIALDMTSKRYGPDHTIYKENSKSDKMYFLISGNVQLYSISKGNSQHLKPVKLVTQGQIFNEIEFLSGQQTQIGAITKDVVYTIQLQKKQFLEKLKEYPQDYEIFQQFKDSINFLNRPKGLGIQCLTCQSFNHFHSSCPYVYYQPNLPQLIQKYIEEDIYQQPRVSDYERIDNRIVNPWLIIEVLRTEAIQFLIDQEGNNDIDGIEEAIKNILTAAEYYEADENLDTFEDEDFQNSFHNLNRPISKTMDDIDANLNRNKERKSSDKSSCSQKVKTQMFNQEYLQQLQKILKLQEFVHNSTPNNQDIQNSKDSNSQSMQNINDNINKNGVQKGKFPKNLFKRKISTTIKNIVGSNQDLQESSLDTILTKDKKNIKIQNQKDNYNKNELQSPLKHQNSPTCRSKEQSEISIYKKDQSSIKSYNSSQNEDPYTQIMKQQENRKKKTPSYINKSIRGRKNQASIIVTDGQIQNNQNSDQSSLLNRRISFYNNFTSAYTNYNGNLKNNELGHQNTNKQFNYSQYFPPTIYNPQDNQDAQTPKKNHSQIQNPFAQLQNQQINMQQNKNNQQQQQQNNQDEDFQQYIFVNQTIFKDTLENCDKVKNWTKYQIHNNLNSILQQYQKIYPEVYGDKHRRKTEIYNDLLFKKKYQSKMGKSIMKLESGLRQQTIFRDLQSRCGTHLTKKRASRNSDASDQRDMINRLELTEKSNNITYKSSQDLYSNSQRDQKQNQNNDQLKIDTKEQNISNFFKVNGLELKQYDSKKSIQSNKQID